MKQGNDMPRPTILTAMVVVLLSPTLAAAADVEAGKTQFNKCKICHSLEPGKNGVGPGLHAIFGRKAGTADNYAFSDAMKNSGIVWDDDTMTKYVRDPKEVVPGGKMAFPGIKDDQQLADLLAYLHQATQ
jgi:cytochrome c